MALDPTARESNLRDSIKKFFVDNIARGESIPITFDRGLVNPRLQGQVTKKWVSLIFGPMERGYLSSAFLQIYICTREDNEGFKLAQLGDKVMGILHDSNHTDGMARIPFYRSLENEPWELIGAIVVQEVIEGGSFDIEDETKVKLLTARLRWASKI